MTTIPQVARAMREIFTTTADEAARPTRFVQRPSPLGGAPFSQPLGCGVLGNPHASLEELTQTAAALGGDIRPQALAQRFTAPAAACLQQVWHAALARVVTADPVALPVLGRFTAVLLQDSATLVLPEALAAVWQGCGGSPPAQTSAALTLQGRLAMRTGRLDVQRQDGRSAARVAQLPGPLPAGALRLAALGSWSLEALQGLEQPGVFWLSRLQTQTAVDDTTGCRRDLLALLDASATDTVEPDVALGGDQRVPARLLAGRVPQDVAATRRRRWRDGARKQGRQSSATRLALAAWTILVTNVPRPRLTLQEAVVVGRGRWHIARLVKVWKSHGGVDESRRKKPWRMLCEVSATWLAMLLQHWMVLLGWWASPHRSLVKAAQTGRKHALHLASAFDRLKRLTTALTTVTRCLAAGCRMHRRKKHPNTYQLLLDAT